ncbi:hypothetical protein ACPV5O_21325 [Vibrio maritimus]|uniref:hypothetical protein n=1 Tax=Vibrio maritimus TaxID=990268 RepID=UPI004068C7F8
MYLRNINYLCSDREFSESELIEANNLTDRDKNQIWDKGFHKVASWDTVEPKEFLGSSLTEMVSELTDDEQYAVFTFESSSRMKVPDYHGLCGSLLESAAKKPCMAVNLDMACHGPTTIIASIAEAIKRGYYDVGYVVVLSDVHREAKRPSIFEINRMDGAMIIEIAKSGKYKIRDLYSYTDSSHLDLFNPHLSQFEKLKVTSRFLKDEGQVLRKLIEEAKRKYDGNRLLGVSLPIITKANQSMIENLCAVTHIKPSGYPLGTFACGDTFLPLIGENNQSINQKFKYLCSLGAAFTWNLLVLERI